MASTRLGDDATAAQWSAVVISAVVVLGTLTATVAPLAPADGRTADAAAVDPAPDDPLTGTLSLADADATFRGGGMNDSFGDAVANVGDVNGDGYRDVAVGAPFNDTGAKYGGAVFVFFGPVEADELHARNADATLYRDARNSRAGESVAAADVNGDGVSDLVVGAPHDDANGHDAGAAFVVHGGEDFGGETALSTADHVLYGDDPDDLVGFDVAGVGAPDDGVRDRVLVGAPWDDDAGRNAGAAYVLDDPPTGESAISAAADAKLTGEAAGDWAGWSVATAENFDGDGGHDLLVGAPHANRSASNAGAAYVVTDGSLPASSSLADARLALAGVDQRDGAGWDVATAGDVNDDGSADVVVGAPFADENGNQSGAAYVVLGGANAAGVTSLADAAVVLDGEAAGDRAGWAVSSAGSGDVTCDDYADVLVGAPGNDHAGPNAGAAYLVVGASDPQGTRNLADAHATLRGASARDRAGTALSDVGSVTRDDTKDVVVGAPNADTTQPDAGEVALFDGECEPPEEPPETTTEPTTTEPTTTRPTTTEPTTTEPTTTEPTTTEPTTTEPTTTEPTTTEPTTTEPTTTEPTTTEPTTTEPTTTEPTTTEPTTTEPTTTEPTTTEPTTTEPTTTEPTTTEPTTTEPTTTTTTTTEPTTTTTTTTEPTTTTTTTTEPT
ncbi:integrin alpha, partial [Halorubellus sp. PRR65]|uniref:integrin alpha n=1 Tax=Halorubellus sp. PRR65 TaxID=3098148 RepID=UPI002B25C86C